MNKIASLTLDVVDYIINDEVDKLAELVQDLSDDAKVAYIPSFEEQSSMDEIKFAAVLWHPTLGKFNKYAMNDSGITEVNLAILAKNAKTLPEEVLKIAAANLTCAANKFKLKVPEELSKYASTSFIPNLIDIRDIDEVGYLTKVSDLNTESNYALPEQNKYPINNKEEIEKSAQYFDLHHNDFDPNTKLEIALNIRNAAAGQDIDVSDSLVTKYANFLDVETFNEDFADHINIRKSYLKDDDPTMDLYSELIEKSAELEPNKVATVLYELDKTSGLAFNYGKGIEDPIISTFGTVKEAGMYIDDTMVTSDQLQSIKSADLTPIVGNDVIPELKGEEGLDVLASLPKPIRAEVLNLM